MKFTELRIEQKEREFIREESRYTVEQKVMTLKSF